MKFGPARCSCRGLLFVLMALGCDSRHEPQLNVVLFVVDTLRADALSAYGNESISTPNVDRLAAEGALFERAYAPASWTRASMAALLTGHHADAIDMEGIDSALPDNVPLLAERLRSSGYLTAAVVGNPNVGSFYGFDRGFDRYVELYQRRGPDRAPESELLTDTSEIVDSALAWLDAATEPFFLLVLAIDPHWPYAPPGEFDDHVGNEAFGADLARLHGRYLGEVAFVDHEFGRLLASIDARGFGSRTLVVFTSDHGEEFGEHGGRGHGRTLFEEAIRVPLVLRLPGVFDPGQRFAHPVPAVNLVPTILSLAGLPMPSEFEERSVLGSGPGPHPVYASLDRQREGSGISLIDYPWKLVLGARTGGIALFHLRRDPGETTNLAAVEVREFDRLLGTLRATRQRNQEKRGRLRDADRVPVRELPEDARRALEALGYLETGADRDSLRDPDS